MFNFLFSKFSNKYHCMYVNMPLKYEVSPLQNPEVEKLFETLDFGLSIYYYCIGAEIFLAAESFLHQSVNLIHFLRYRLQMAYKRLGFAHIKKWEYFLSNFYMSQKIFQVQNFLFKSGSIYLANFPSDKNIFLKNTVSNFL